MPKSDRDLKMEAKSLLLMVSKQLIQRAKPAALSKDESEHELAAPGKPGNNNSLKRTVEIETASEDDDKPPPKRKRARKARPRKPPPALYKASARELAESDTITVTGSTADIDNTIILRIKKCIERARHPNTPEVEAKRAFYLASRLMAQYNVSQAEVLAHQSPDRRGDTLGRVSFMSHVLTGTQGNLYATTASWTSFVKPWTSFSTVNIIPLRLLIRVSTATCD